MASSYSSSIFFLLSLCLAFSTVALGGNFYNDFDILYGDKRANIKDGGKSMTLTMDKYSGSGIVSKIEYLFGRFDMQIKLIPGNSAGTVTTFYLSSQGDHHDEIDLEFLGNLSGDPYLLSTNIYANGNGGREMQFYLWFDPTQDFHTYSIDWNAQRIIILVDNIPIRVMHNRQSIGVPFPTRQPMRVYTTLWNGDSWATRWGQVKLDWSQAPFIAGFRNFNANACIPRSGASCVGFNGGRNKGLSAETRKKLKEIHSKWAVYDYCRDFRRYAHGLPYECRKNNVHSALE
ncbi:xyloglucan endotransglucosylase protein 1-like [Gastrolobium bilobum]|uniref:xyloglucan endotransglucosylase protein 1-like n=1 Tax=Gastrolobium bilobum TaxID=150636 RepID=UPI002AAF843F|nr:xyloglucan endotransglucosylase protein 1-like [Gastrolobium bilobum]